jgi:hypothetical protein
MIRYLPIAIALLIPGVLMVSASRTTQAQVANQPFSVTITVNPACTAIQLSNTTVTTNGPNNAGLTVGALTVTANPPAGTYLGTLTLGGASGASFAITNAGKLPANLNVGPANLPAGSYAITISCT